MQPDQTNTPGTGMPDDVSGADSPGKPEATLAGANVIEPAKTQAPQTVIEPDTPHQSIRMSSTIVGPHETTLGILAGLAFRFGFASIFLINAVYASLYPEDFIRLFDQNAVAGIIGHKELLVQITMINDLLLGALILWGRYKTFVYAWAGVWLLMVAGLKLMNIPFF